MYFDVLVSFSLFLLCNVYVAVSSVSLYARKIIWGAQKCSGESQDQNTFLTPLFLEGGGVVKKQGAAKAFFHSSQFGDSLAARLHKHRTASV